MQESVVSQTPEKEVVPMASLFAKARLVVLSTAHSLLDKAVDLNSIQAVRQYVRDLEEALEDLESAAASAAGHVRTVTRQHEKLQTQVSELSENIDFIVSNKDESDNHLALKLEVRLGNLQNELKSVEAELSSANQTAQALNEATSRLRTKHESTVGQLRRLEALDRTAKAKEGAADALRAVGRVSGAEVSVDDVTERIQSRADVADEKFARAMGGLADTVDQDVAVAQAAARLAARKQRLAGESTP